MEDETSHFMAHLSELEATKEQHLTQLNILEPQRHNLQSQLLLITKQLHNTEIQLAHQNIQLCKNQSELLQHRQMIVDLEQKLTTSNRNIQRYHDRTSVVREQSARIQDKMKHFSK